MVREQQVWPPPARLVLSLCVVWHCPVLFLAALFKALCRPCPAPGTTQADKVDVYYEPALHYHYESDAFGPIAHDFLRGQVHQHRTCGLGVPEALVLVTKLVPSFSGYLLTGLLSPCFSAVNWDILVLACFTPAVLLLLLLGTGVAAVASRKPGYPGLLHALVLEPTRCTIPQQVFMTIAQFLKLPWAAVSVYLVPGWCRAPHRLNTFSYFLSAAAPWGGWLVHPCSYYFYKVRKSTSIAQTLP